MKRYLSILLVLNMALPLFGQAPRRSVKEFLEMASTDTTSVELRGVVSRIRNYDRGRLFLSDGTGTVLIYGLGDRNRRGVPALDIRKGDTLSVMGRRTVYNRTTIEMKDALYLDHRKGPDHDNVPRIDELDKDPSFKGGFLKEFTKWVEDKVVIPADARPLPGDGTIEVQFVVGFDGSVLEPEVLGGAGPSLKAEILSVMKKAPKWKPGEVNGRKMRVKYTIRIDLSGK